MNLQIECSACGGAVGCTIGRAQQPAGDTLPDDNASVHMTVATHLTAQHDDHHHQHRHSTAAKHRKRNIRRT